MQNLMIGSLMALASAIALIFGLSIPAEAGASSLSSLSSSSRSNNHIPPKADHNPRNKSVPDKKPDSAPSTPSEKSKPKTTEEKKEALPTEVPVYQGQKLSIHAGDRWVQCAVSFVDTVARRAYTAEHCIWDSKKQPVDGAEIRVYSDPDNPDKSHSTHRVLVGKGRVIGAGSDIAYVELNDAAILSDSANGFAPTSTDREAKMGDRVCAFSRMMQKTTCGDVIYVGDNKVRAKVEVQPGDSGGPAWFEDTHETMGVLSTKYDEGILPSAGVAPYSSIKTFAAA